MIRDCSRKRAYYTEAACIRQIRELQSYSKNRHEKRYYRCYTCHNYHLTSKPYRKKR